VVSTYVLSALEPVGSVPDHATGAGRHGAAPTVRAVARLYPELQLLHHQADEDDLRPVLSAPADPLCFLARSEDHLRRQPIALDDKGAYSGQRESGPNATRGVRSCSPAAMAEKTLYYFSTDLSNSGVHGLKFPTLAPNSSLKSVLSLHSGNFTTVRDCILANSAVHHSDDPGVPLACRKQWRFFPLVATRPDRGIPRLEQPAYAELFRAQPADRFRHIAGARMNPTCCCRSLPSDGSGSGRHAIGRTSAAPARRVRVPRTSARSAVSDGSRKPQTRRVDAAPARGTATADTSGCPAAPLVRYRSGSALLAARAAAAPASSSRRPTARNARSPAAIAEQVGRWRQL
jgi:hypothetical protein